MTDQPKANITFLEYLRNDAEIIADFTNGTRNIVLTFDELRKLTDRWLGAGRFIELESLQELLQDYSKRLEEKFDAMDATELADAEKAEPNE